MENAQVEKTLKDGSTILIREMTVDDDQKLFEFFNSLPLNDRLYLRIDVTKIENIRKRMDMGALYNNWRLVAEKDGKIWGDATLCSPKTGWSRHTCELRSIVHSEYQGKGLASAMVWEIFKKALSNKVHMIRCEVVPEQERAIAMLKKLGFKKVLVRPKQVKDIVGDTHDLLIFSLDVKAMWETLKNHSMIHDLGPS